jgi:hypothetical protein
MLYVSPSSVHFGTGGLILTGTARISDVHTQLSQVHDLGRLEEEDRELRAV